MNASLTRFDDSGKKKMKWQEYIYIYRFVHHVVFTAIFFQRPMLKKVTNMQCRF